MERLAATDYMSEVGKELRLKQQYFWAAASLADILRRFKNLNKPITEFPDCKCYCRKTNGSHTHSL